MEQNTAILKLEKYEEFIELKYQIKELQKENEKLEKENKDLKKYVLENSLDDYNIRNYDLEELLDIDNYKFWLENTKKLLKVLSIDEMTDFIKEKWNEYHNEVEDE